MPATPGPVLEDQSTLRAALLQGLSPGEIAAVLRAGRPRHLKRGAFFFREGEPAGHIYLLRHGQVTLLQVTPEGQQVILRLVGPGEAFGVIAGVAGASYPASARAAEDCQAITWSGEQIGRLMEGYPRLALNTVRALTGYIRELQDRYRELVTERVERRVARTLLRLVRQVGRRVENGVLIDMPLSRRSLAEMSGTTLYTVSRIMAAWEQRGLVSSARERVTIRYPHGLTMIAEDLVPAPDALSSSEPR